MLLLLPKPAFKRTLDFNTETMKTILYSLTFAAFVLTATSFKSPAPNNDSVKWMTWKEMQEAQQKQPKKILVDVYTEWCGWCKRMDAGTYTNAEIIKYINENFYAVKFDAEDKNVINFNGKEYKYVPQSPRGYNELAAQILNGQMSYPTVVYFDEKLAEITAVPGYQDPKMLEKVLNFINSDSYKTTDWTKYESTFQGKIQ
jgi:thioredoxin-related protein